MENIPIQELYEEEEEEEEEEKEEKDDKKDNCYNNNKNKSKNNKENVIVVDNYSFSLQLFTLFQNLLLTSIIVNINLPVI